MITKFIRLDKRAATILMLIGGILLVGSIIMSVIAPNEAWYAINRSAVGICIATMVLGSLK